VAREAARESLKNKRIFQVPRGGGGESGVQRGNKKSYSAESANAATKTQMTRENGLLEKSA